MIDFTPEQEQALGKAARRQGTTPELLVMSAVEMLLAPIEEDATVPEGGSLADQLSYYIGAVDSAEHAPDGAPSSRPAGTEFGKLLLERHREGSS